MSAPSERDLLAEALHEACPYTLGASVCPECGPAADALLASPQFARLIAEAEARGTARNVTKCARCGQVDVLNQHPLRDIVVCERCALAEGAARVREAVEAEYRKEVERLSDAVGGDPWQEPMLNNWLGGLKTAVFAALDSAERETEAGA
jgi:ribosomal protein S27AE